MEVNHGSIMGSQSGRTLANPRPGSGHDNVLIGGCRHWADDAGDGKAGSGRSQ